MWRTVRERGSSSGPVGYARAATHYSTGMTGPAATAQIDAALADLYERFPYPRSIGDIGDFAKGHREPTWNPKSSFGVFFPEHRPRADLDILVAGCGTNLAPVFAATMPKARVVGVDISGASLQLSEAMAAEGGLTNLTHHQLPLEEVATLKDSFDFVVCTGVIHHLASPRAGLEALRGVLRPEGAMMVMVYARYGRQGIAMLAELCRRLGMSINELDAAKAQRLLAHLPPRHPFRLVYAHDSAAISLEEVMDMLLNPRDASYRVDDIESLVRESGLGFHRWLGNAEYRPQMSAIEACGLGSRAADLDPWGQAAAAELAHGSLFKHSFVLTHPQRTSAESLFAGDTIATARPSLCAHIVVRHVGDNLVVTNSAHQVPIQLAAPVGDIGPILKAADGTRTVAEIVGSSGRAGFELYRRLYHADAITLSRPG